MGTYDFKTIEKKWQQYWKDNKTFLSKFDTTKPKYYVLDMFPYPSGSGLHAGHPLGYVGTDIVARYKRLKGFNVLHPMGFDAFGLPAEQYAIETGTHPLVTTEKNIATYRRQFDNIGLGYDPNSLEMKTSDPSYYKWTQWIFLKIFNSWFNLDNKKAETIEHLEVRFSKSGSKGANAWHSPNESFTADEWNNMSREEKNKVLLDYRIAYTANAMVNWCPALGTVLANDEVINGVSERGGHPVVRKPMLQWQFRMTAYADRLLQGLNTIDWPEPIKEMQRHWIGRSEGALIDFHVAGREDKITVFSTRPDTIFGATFIALAPEHELAPRLATHDRVKDVLNYIETSKNKSEIDRMSEVKNISGVFTGSYAIHPFTNAEIPIWIGDYILGGYGTGSVMAVPAHDSRDYSFAKKFGIEILEVVSGGDISIEAYESKEGILVNSGSLTGLHVKEAIAKVIEELEATAQGKAKINYRLRDPNFSRQRYWGEPIPIVYKNGIPEAVDESELPVVLPEVDSYQPTGSGESPLAGLKWWVNREDGSKRETNTMPGYAGSSWYFLRYLDLENENYFCNAEKSNYWMGVDLYIGGSEHAVGHLLYSRFWTKVLFDLGYIGVDEPFKKLVNQGMIQGRSSIVYRLYADKMEADHDYANLQEFIINADTTGIFLSKSVHEKLMDLNYQKEITEKIEHLILKFHHDKGHKVNSIKITGIRPSSDLRIKLSYVNNDELDYKLYAEKENLITGKREPVFILEDKDGNPSGTGKYICGYEIEKMSKRYHNVINPDDLCEKYGADTFRLYEMFLGPLELSKPFLLNGIEGSHKFLKRVWVHITDEENNIILTQEEPTNEELKVLHQTIKKTEEDIERLSFNTAVSQFMIFLNEIQKLNCKKRAIFEPFIKVLSPYAPHIAEELWQKLGNKTSILESEWPKWDEKYLISDSFDYPVSLNGKVKGKINFPLSLTKEELENLLTGHEEIVTMLKGQAVKKMIVVHGKIINLVV